MGAMQHRLAVTGPARPDEVWDRYLRPARWSEWSPQIRRVDASDDTIRAGTRGRVWGPPGLAVDFTVDAVDAASRTWSWHVRVLLLGIRLSLRHGVSRTSSGGTRAWLDVTGPRPVVLAYAPVARLALRRLCRP